MDEIRSDRYPLHPAFDPSLAAWLTSLEELTSSEFTIREATAGSADARWLRYMQGACEPIDPQPESENDKTIAGQLVLFAMVGQTPVGFCVSMTDTAASDPMFIQTVGVVGTARGRGIGLALMHAVAEQAPDRNIALATQNDNLAARRMNERFAASIGAELRRLNLGTYNDDNLGIRRGLGYRAWTIDRSHPTADSPITSMG
ncbi:GNAT family N-acetyltransferase (plasmid) [Curtobacterium sp. TC1]|uniref:GNAT family N-acetyltransferase n=1 Tax=Curtobacterium sp. TC1 TaxID=2862880 RepID=UPI001C9AA588|nr:GNAT family N-acetyltransferase [Curtobacterium sp. TC1]QZQ53608.1 GNAT family N-acetyltransferase [Curtobacterium sp. TC1]